MARRSTAEARIYHTFRVCSMTDLFWWNEKDEQACNWHLAGRPNDSGWDQTEANDAMGKAKEPCVSHGGGRQAPGKISNSARNTTELDELLASIAIERLAGFANGMSVVRRYSGTKRRCDRRSAQLCTESLQNLLDDLPDEYSPAAMFNFGPHTVTYEHTDSEHFASVMCSITALGEYNAVTGGHLILFDVDVII
ncbi:hypothetical protein M405DRAFT_847310 [Rhizopogon salebrosus TDB-379]|nr:hypothetical protein M405DRAFT_847310 [Rhizopogon salebrosus TDB-379]